MTHAPHELRARARDVVLREAEEHGFAVHGFDKVTEWRAVMAASRASLAPRGFGRTSYHLMETLQMGLVPIHVYTDVPWVPYARVFARIGFAANVSGLPAVMHALHRMSAAELEEREALAVRLRGSHFSEAGLMAQISRFMLDGGSDLLCQPLPVSRTDEPVRCRGGVVVR